jgi:hypothetical protein
VFLEDRIILSKLILTSYNERIKSVLDNANVSKLLECSVQKLPTELKPTSRLDSHVSHTGASYNQWRRILYTQRVAEGKPTTLQSQLSYGGCVFNDLKLHNIDAPLQKLATKLVELFGEEDSDGPMALAIEDIIYRIRNQGGDIDSAMAKFSVQAYAARNQVCHGKARHLVIEEK